MFSNVLSGLKRQLVDRQMWLSFIAGLSLVFAYAPFNLWWLPLVVIPVWLANLDKIALPNFSAKLLAKHGFSFGFGWFASGISWVHVSIAEFGGMPLIASIALMVLLCLYLALFPSLAFYLIGVIAKKAKLTSGYLLLLPSVWMLTEYCREVFLTGFPWLSLGYSQLNSPLSSLAPVVGELGISFAIVAICVVIALLIRQEFVKTSAAVLLVSGAAIALSANQEFVKPTGETVRVALVQGNIEQSIKWEPEQQWPTMLKYLDLSKQNFDADIVVWPESAIPAIETMTSTQEFLDIANTTATLNKSSIITGIINYQFEAKEYYNALVVLGQKHQDDIAGSYYYGNRNRFYKHHLLPIGEFVPFEDLLRPIAPFFNLPMSSFSRGDYVQNNLLANSRRILPLICFEIAFANQLKANFVNDTDMLLTVSNDAWFGDSHGPHQHMEIAQMRALEFGRPLLRATNTGVTAITDHYGQFTAKAPQFEQSVIKHDVELVDGQTPFSKFGHFTIYILALAWFGIALFVLKRHSP